jgi:hypothetical protein
MTVLTRIAPTTTSLQQHLITCPGCGSSAAVHVSLDGMHPTAVRVVCATGCADNDILRVAAVDTLYPLAAIA